MRTKKILILIISRFSHKKFFNMNNLNNVYQLINHAQKLLDNKAFNQEENLKIALIYLNEALSFKNNTNYLYLDDKSIFLNAFLIRAKIFLQVGDYLGCINDCNTSEGIDSSEYCIYLLRGDAKLELNKFGEAIYDYEKGILRNPNDPNLFMGKGIAEFELSNFKEALNNFYSAKKRSFSLRSNFQLLDMYITMSESYVKGELISINDFLSKFEK